MNVKMIIAIVLAILGVVIASTAQLTDLFGPNTAKMVVTIASLVNSVLAGIQAALTTQTAQVQSVLAMDGVEHLEVNSGAGAALSAMAGNPDVKVVMK